MYCCCLTSGQVKRIMIETRLNPIVNRLNKTKTEKHPDLYQEREDRLKVLRERERVKQQERVWLVLLYYILVLAY